MPLSNSSTSSISLNVTRAVIRKRYYLLWAGGLWQDCPDLRVRNQSS
ncbi:hypothetical protein KCP76_20255 [Salmonella enterica subsp. enterica serovar Weltevreden]|nr:hypothetical protein KCP76_20255 [Salmonella enterica subsp. enterica serovar Weltevreden]